VASTLYAVPSIWLLRNYLQPAFDLAIYDQSLWLILNGETFNTIIASHVLGVHFSPVLYPLSVLAVVPGGAVPEIVLQSLLIASGVFPAAALADRLGKPRSWFIAAYAIHPAIIGGSWYGFRPWNLAVPVFMWAIFWMVKRPTSVHIVIAGLGLLLFREDLAIWAGLAALVLALAGRITWRALVLPGVVLGAATAVVLLGVLPAISPTDSYFFATSAETTVPSIPSSVSSLAIRALFVLVPFGVMPSLIRWRLVMPAVIPALALVFKGGNALTTYFHYDMMFVPLLLLAMALSPEARSNTRVVVAASMTMLLLFGVLRPLPPQHGPNPWRYDPELTARIDETIESLSRVDGYRTTSLTAPSHLVPHLSERENIFVYPEPLHRSDTDDLDQYADVVTFDCPAPNIVISLRSRDDQWQALLDSDYDLVGADDALPVWKRVTSLPNDPCEATWHRP
jgi:uncharacterized membrane protein